MTIYSLTAAAAAKSHQSCLTLCDPIEGSPQAPPSLGFSRQEYWSGVPLPSLIQPWHTPFPIWNQSVVPCPVLTVASWPAYKCLKRQVRWSGIQGKLKIARTARISKTGMEWILPQSLQKKQCCQHLLQLMKPHQHTITTQSPWFIPGFTVCIVHSMGWANTDIYLSLWQSYREFSLS